MCPPFASFPPFPSPLPFSTTLCHLHAHTHTVLLNHLKTAANFDTLSLYFSMNWRSRTFPSIISVINILKSLIFTQYYHLIQSNFSISLVVPK